MKIQKVGVVGCGLMGSGIAEVCARNGYDVVVLDLTDGILKQGLGRIEKSLSKAVSKGKLSEEEREKTLSRIGVSTKPTDLADRDLVIEAVLEDLEEKNKVFAELDQILGPNALITINSSSLRVIEIASATERRDKVLGTHFFYPAPVIPLIELVRTILTRDETMSIVQEFAASMGKKTIVAKDRPGYVCARLIIPFLLDAVRACEEGLASKEDIDTALEMGMNHPMGPLTVIDFFGLDTLLLIADGLFEEFKDPRFAAPTLLRRMVAAGHLGRKTGQGFYQY